MHGLFAFHLSLAVIYFINRSQKREQPCQSGIESSKLLKCLGRKCSLDVSEGALKKFTLHLFLYFIVRHVPCIVCRQLTGTALRAYVC